MDVTAPIHLLRAILRASLQAEVNPTALTYRQVASTALTGVQAHQDFACELPRIPIKRLRDLSRNVYVSELPALLAGQGSTSAEAIADELLQRIWVMQKSSEVTAQILPIELVQGFTVSRTARNALCFEFHDPAIAYWLTGLMNCNLSWEIARSGQPWILEPQRVFTVQHALARCCSWLRHAEQGHFIQLDPSKDPQHWSLTTSISWLAVQQLQFTHMAERQLGNQLIAVLDIWVDPPRQNVEKQLFLCAEAVTHAFHEAHRVVPIFGRQERRDRLQAHLGLLFITQRILRQLLQSLQIVTLCNL